MFVLSRRFGALADRSGRDCSWARARSSPRPGILLLLRTGLRHVAYVTDLLPALLVFSLGLSMTVAPLTATVLADADENDAGIASAINNAVARVAGLSASRSWASSSRDPRGRHVRGRTASVRAFHQVMLVCAALVGTGGVIGLLGIVNPPSASARTETARPSPAT